MFTIKAIGAWMLMAECISLKMFCFMSLGFPFRSTSPNPTSQPPHTPTIILLSLLNLPTLPTLPPPHTPISFLFHSTPPLNFPHLTIQTHPAYVIQPPPSPFLHRQLPPHHPLPLPPHLPHLVLVFLHLIPHSLLPPLT